MHSCAPVAIHPIYTHLLPSGRWNNDRYLDIIPTKATAVSLPEIEGEGPLSQYINANYIAGSAGQPKQFIAAMGPKEDTLGAWWRMIWHEHAQAVVMLTNVTEKGKKKCANYLPRLEEVIRPPTHGPPFEISLLNREVNHDYMVSTLLIKHAGEERKITHYWYHTVSPKAALTCNLRVALRAYF
jgi:protein tyrosine phosphatase